MAEGILSSRASGFAQDLRCAGAIMLKNEASARTSSAPSELGTRLHDYLAAYARTGATPKHLTDTEAPLFWTGRKIIESLKPYMQGEIHVEGEVSIEVPHGNVTGHVDLYALSEERLVVVDYKSGWRTAMDFLPQLKGYALLVCKKHGVFPKEIYVVPATLRTGEYEVIQVPPEELESLERQLADNIFRAAHADRSDLSAYTTGEHCSGCSARMRCPALAQTLVHVRAMMQAELDKPGPKNKKDRMMDLASFSDHELATLRWQSRVLKDMADVIDRSIKAVAMGRPIKLSEDRVYGRIETSEKQLNTHGVLRWLSHKGMKHDDAMELFSTTWSRLEGWVKEDARRRKEEGEDITLKDAVEQAENELSQAGALVYVPAVEVRETKV